MQDRGKEGEGGKGVEEPVEECKEEEEEEIKKYELCRRFFLQGKAWHVCVCACLCARDWMFESLVPAPGHSL